MIKNHKSNHDSEKFIRGVWTGLCSFFYGFWIFLKTLAEAIWELLQKSSKFFLGIWALVLASLITIALVYFLISSRIKNLDETSLLKKVLKYFEPFSESVFYRPDHNR